VAELDRDKDGAADGVTVRRPPQMGADPGPGDAPGSTEKQSDHPCFQCVQCCTYVAIEIDTPSTMKEYDYIFWYLYHQGVSVFVDWESNWFIKFETRCEHLSSRGLCNIYSSRPVICKWLFENSDQFLRWFEKKRPKAFQRFQKYMRKKHRAGEEKELERLKIR